MSDIAEAVRWCVDCDRIEALVDSPRCYRCERRSLAGEPPLAEVRQEEAAKANRQYVSLPGYWNRDL
jgi:hypothetical protein